MQICGLKPDTLCSPARLERCRRGPQEREQTACSLHCVAYNILTAHAERFAHPDSPGETQVNYCTESADVVL